MKTTKNKQNIEYEDAPSGFVTFYNYKEPLMKFEGGFGFVGALVFDGDTDKIQCHFCGEWFGSLSHHLAREHGMTASQYKEKVGLFQTTALISESARAKLIASGLDKRLANLRKGTKKSEETKKKIAATLRVNAQKSESKNLRGTCPAQLIDRMQKIAKERGKDLRMADFDSFDELLRTTFGSTKEACALAGIPYHPPCHPYGPRKRKYTREDFIAFAREYMTRFNDFPRWIDFKKQGRARLWESVTTKYDIRELRTEAYAGLEAYKYAPSRVTYSKEDLLGFLRKFEKINGRKPSYSDCKRQLLPNLSRYSYNFGSWKNALDLAFK